MLLTTSGWEEIHPLRRSLVSPFTPWECIGVTTESPSFMIDKDQSSVKEKDALKAFIVSGVEPLLDALSELAAADHRVYIIDFSEDMRKSMQFSLLSSLNSYQSDGIKWFTYTKENGSPAPCSPFQPPPEFDSAWTIEWMST